jgi:hypothetical protein
MPICERDPWRLQFFEKTNCPDDVNIPTDDPDCWNWYPEQRWIYDKLNIAQSQGIVSGRCTDMPPHFPVFSKPQVNLKGMGLNAFVIEDAAAFKHKCLPGNMWMELLTGTHVSTDCAIENGKMKWCRHATGIAWRDAMFKHWIIHADRDIALETYLKNWIEKHMTGYTGMINFESIGGKIIEVHLRFADQWCDLYGDGWNDALVRLYAEGRWVYDTSSLLEGYSIPLFASHGGNFKHPSCKQQFKIKSMPYVKSLQITFNEIFDHTKHAMPSGGFRLGIVNSTNLEAGFAARRELAEMFPSVEIMLPE